VTGQEVSIRYCDCSCSGQEGQRSHVQSLGIHMRESNRKPTGRVQLAVAGHGSNWHPTCRKGFLQCNLFNVLVAVNEFLLLHIPWKNIKMAYRWISLNIVKIHQQRVGMAGWQPGDFNLEATLCALFWAVPARCGESFPGTLAMLSTAGAAFKSELEALFT